MIPEKGHIYLIKNTMQEFSRIDITGKDYYIMAVPDDCMQLCHVDDKDILKVLQRRDCTVCQLRNCSRSPAFKSGAE